MDSLAAFVITGLGNGAGIDKTEVGPLSFRGSKDTARSQFIGQRGRLGKIELAAQSDVFGPSGGPRVYIVLQNISF